MAASYPGAVKTFTTKASGGAILAAHINDLQDEVVAVETQLGVNAGTWQSWTPTLTWSVGSVDPTYSLLSARYTRVGKMVTFSAGYLLNGGNYRNYKITVPINPVSSYTPVAGYQSVVTNNYSQPLAVVQNSDNTISISCPSPQDKPGYVMAAGTYEIA
jgi:hypothetical protein